MNVSKRDDEYMKIWKFIVQNIVLSITGTFLSFMLRFYETPTGRIIENVALQMLRNFVIIFICLTVGRLLVSCIRKKMMKWDRKKTERWEKLLIPALYAVLILIIYFLLESIGPGVPLHLGVIG